MQRLERIHFLSRADKLKPVREVVRELARRQGCSQDNLDCLVMAINEACMNVMQHAYGDRENGEIILEFWLDDEQLVIRIYDFAEKVNPEKIKSRNLDDLRPGGLGVHLIHQVMDEVAYIDIPDEPGNLLQMKKRIGKASQCMLKTGSGADEKIPDQ
jgi:anti-sigma regulatory factor (Ser/Thr protein kinase)